MKVYSPLKSQVQRIDLFKQINNGKLRTKAATKGLLTSATVAKQMVKIQTCAYLPCVFSFWVFSKVKYAAKLLCVITHFQKTHANVRNSMHIIIWWE